MIVGDAAHSTTPDIGQGGCQAMEDAIYLARALQINTLGLQDDAVIRINAMNVPMNWYYVRVNAAMSHI